MTVALSAQLTGFFEALGKDEAAAAKLKAALETTDDPAREVIGQAAALGITLTEDDIKTMQQASTEQPLNDDELEQVGGGSHSQFVNGVAQFCYAMLKLFKSIEK